MRGDFTLISTSEMTNIETNSFKPLPCVFYSRKQWYDWHRAMEKQSTSHVNCREEMLENPFPSINKTGIFWDLHKDDAELVEEIKELCSKIQFSHLTLSSYHHFLLLFDLIDI